MTISAWIIRGWRGAAFFALALGLGVMFGPGSGWFAPAYAQFNDRGYDRGYDRGDDRYDRGDDRYDRRQNDQGYDRRQPPQADGYDRRAEYCHELEQRLVDRWRRRNRARDQLPQLNADIRKADHEFHRAQAEAERKHCYEEMFFFGRSLKRTPNCLKIGRTIEEARRTLRSLQDQRRAIQDSGRDRGEENLIAQLARNGCGEDYVRQYRANQRSHSLFSFWEDGDFRGSPGAGPSSQQPSQPGELPFATYRTMCVRLCDGYYYPISFSTLPSQFDADATKCQSSCAAPAQLFVYRNPGEEIEQMVSPDGQAYSALPNAWRYRKQFIKGCSCQEDKFSVEEIARSEAALKAAAATPSNPEQGRGKEPAVAESSATGNEKPAPGDQQKTGQKETGATQSPSSDQPVIRDLNSKEQTGGVATTDGPSDPTPKP